MRRILIVVTLLSFVGVGLASGRQKDVPAANWATAKKVLVGWVDINLDDWAVLGYGNSDEWSEVIKTNNVAFQRVVQEKLPGRQVAGAKSRTEEDAAGQDLQVKFSDVRFDTESYRLFLSIHFVDPQTGSELASVPVEGYRGGHFSVNSCMKGALEKVAERLEKEMQRRAKQK